MWRLLSLWLQFAAEPQTRNLECGHSLWTEANAAFVYGLVHEGMNNYKITYFHIYFVVAVLSGWLWVVISQCKSNKQLVIICHVRPLWQSMRGNMWSWRNRGDQLLYALKGEIKRLKCNLQPLSLAEIHFNPLSFKFIQLRYFVKKLILKKLFSHEKNL